MRDRALLASPGPSCEPTLRTVTEVLYGIDAAHRDRVAALRGEGEYFWLDASLQETSREDLVDVLDCPPAALRTLSESGAERVSRAVHVDGTSIGFTVRCYVGGEDRGDDAPQLRPVRVHVVVTAEYLLTLHDERVSFPALLAPDLPPDRDGRYVVYSVLDSMLASGFDLLEEVELTLDAFAATWTDEDGAPISGATLREAGTRLATMRRWATAEEAVFARVGVEIRSLAGFGVDEEPSFDRLTEQVNRLIASIDAATNGLGMLLDLQLNQRAYLVSVIATIFVPLTFITGFFGMNFGWMVDHIDSPAAFLLLGLVVPIVTALLAWRGVVRRFLVGYTPRPKRTPAPDPRP
jgi:magnesium transporter